MNAVYFAGGLVLGFALGLGIRAFLGRQVDASRREELDRIVQTLESKFGAMSLEALSTSTTELLKLFRTLSQTEREQSSGELKSKKELIDQQLSSMNDKLKEVSNLVQNLERDRKEKFGEITEQLKNTNDQTAALLQKTHSLTEVLAGSKSRGQLGEWMAEDVLRTAGFSENINYLRQKAIEGKGSIPDFTFLLPNDLKLNMDVKFPLDNFERYQNATAELEKEKYKTQFFRDVKARIKEVTSRDYISAEQNTVDCVLLFVPNEQIYSFIHEQDRSILDMALKNKVVFCSPVTLFAVLAVIRQSVDHFNLEQTSNEILTHLGTFREQWVLFLQKLESMGKRIDDAQKEFAALSTTRRNQLERPLNKLDELKKQRGVGSPEDVPAIPVAVEKSSRLPEEMHA